MPRVQGPSSSPPPRSFLTISSSRTRLSGSCTSSALPRYTTLADASFSDTRILTLRSVKMLLEVARHRCRRTVGGREAAAGGVSLAAGLRAAPRRALSAVGCCAAGCCGPNPPLGSPPCAGRGPLPRGAAPRLTTAPGGRAVKEPHRRQAAGPRAGC